jgi:hypothetical protein
VNQLNPYYPEYGFYFSDLNAPRMTNESIERSEESFDPELTPEEQEEKARLIAQVLELQSTLEVP